MIEKFYVATPSGQIHGRRVDGAGTPVVLLHRTPVSSAGYAPVLHMLAASGYAALALDTPGFGESFLPAGNPDAATYGRWLLEAIDALGIGQFHLAAHHSGTHFATEIAAAAPDRVISLTLSGVMVAPAEERATLRGEIGNAPSVDADGVYVRETFRLMKSLFLDPLPHLVHAETLGALTCGPARDLAFDAIFAQDFLGLMGRVLADGRVRVGIVQAADDPLTLNGMLQRLREAYPRLPVTQAGPAFLAMPERQPGAFCRAILSNIGTKQTMTNRRYELARSGAGYDLVRADDSVPIPGPGEILVRVRAVSLNRRDLGVRDLSYPVNGADRFAPLSDAAGDVVAVGEGVSRWQVGDRVMSTFFQNHPGGRLTLPAVLSSLGAGGPGVLADHVILAEGGALAVPEGWSYQEAACLPCAAVTAWSALKTLGQVQAGDHVLVLGTGGVALFALQIAAASGAKPIILSSSDTKIGRAIDIGATAGINYRTQPDWDEAVRKLTGGGGVQHVIELGGEGTLRKSVSALGLNGHLALIGALDGFGGQIDALPLIFSALRISAVMVGSQAEHQELADFMADRGLRPIIDQVFPFAEAENAYAHAAKGAFGKVVIALDGG